MSLGPSSLNYYYNVLCPLADKAYQFAFACTLDRKVASEKVYETYLALSNSLPLPGDGETDLVSVIKCLCSQIDFASWQDKTQLIDEKGSSQLESVEDNFLSKIFSPLTIQGRAVVTGVDFLGFDEEQIAFILNLSLADACRLLGAARKILVSSCN